MMKKLLMIAVLLGLAAALSQPLQADSDIFSVNFYALNGNPNPPENVTIEVEQSPGLPEDWATTGWENMLMPWNPGGAQAPETITSTLGSTATFTLLEVRNGGGNLTVEGSRTLPDGDDNGDLMDAGGNGTLEDPANPDQIFDMEVSDIPYDTYEVIIYLGRHPTGPGGDGTGRITFNGVATDFTAVNFDGTFIEVVNSGDTGNYIVYKEVTGSSFTVQVWGTGDGGYNHIRPCGFQFGMIERMDPSPEDGETVKTANPLRLSWTNMAPNDSNDLTYVDVWWGTEPNALAPGGLDFNKIVTGESVDFKDVDSSAEDTYYWRVDSYLNGADNINEPNRVEGQLWSYTAVADLWPTVEIVTLDQMTWSGEGAPLDATVTDDGVSATTIEWSADLPVGISAAFDPGDEVDTTVTLTKVPYSAARITNAGFEDAVLGDGGWGGDPGWSEVGAGAAGSWNPGVNEYGGDAPEGNNIAWVGLGAGETDGGIAQVLAETLASETDYELKVEVGKGTLYDWPGYKVQFLAGGTVLAEDDNTLSIDPDTFATSTVTFDSTGVDPALVGQPLEIRLLVIGAPAGNWAEMNYDDVRLTADPPFSGLGGVETVTVTVAVSDEANPTPDTASIEIDVYDNPCHMARVGQGKSAITDFNANCITGLEELVVMVEAWLDDYSSTGQADRQ